MLDTHPSKTGKYWAEIRKSRLHNGRWVIKFYAPAYEGLRETVILTEYAPSFPLALHLAWAYLLQGQ